MSNSLPCLTGVPPGERFTPGILFNCSFPDNSSFLKSSSAGLLGVLGVLRDVRLEEVLVLSFFLFGVELITMVLLPLVTGVSPSNLTFFGEQGTDDTSGVSTNTGVEEAGGGMGMVGSGAGGSFFFLL